MEEEESPNQHLIEEDKETDITLWRKVFREQLFEEELVTDEVKPNQLFLNLKRKEGNYLNELNDLIQDKS